MDKTEKRRLMQEQKQRWMEDRIRNLSQDERSNKSHREVSASMDGLPVQAHCIVKPSSAGEGRRLQSQAQSMAGSAKYSAWDRQLNRSMDPNSASSAPQPHAARSDAGRSDEKFLNTLTEKLALHIRAEVQREMQDCVSGPRAKDVVVEKMDSYLQDELQTHVCKICLEVMTSPDHTPKLLFPCGHTFCSACLTSLTEKTSRNLWKCPYCRQPIESMAVNQSLKELIDRFAKQKMQIQQSRENTVALDSIFPTTGDRAEPPQRLSSRGAPINSGRVSSKYHAAYQSAEMRRGILSNELQDAIGEMDAIQKRKQNLLAASKHLSGVKEEVSEKIKQLHEELALIDSHLADQRGKQEEVPELHKQENSVQEKMDLLKRTIAGIKSDMERMLLIAEGATDA